MTNNLTDTHTLINGVASGDTDEDSTILWTRSTKKGKVRFTYSLDPTFETSLKTKTALVTTAALPVKVELNKLKPNTTYYYRVTDAAGSSLTGKFQTAATQEAYQGLNFGVSGDWQGNLAPYPAISNVPKQNLAFFVELGDTIYADVPSSALKNPDGSRKKQAFMLQDFRAKHGEVYATHFGINSWADLRASTSILATIDDHEVINDFAGGVPSRLDPRFGTKKGLINDTPLYKNALKAFQEYNPIRNEYYGDTKDNRTAGKRQLYRYRTYGKDAAAFLLDTRSFRDGELTPPNLKKPSDVNRFLKQSLTRNRTLLGKAQLKQLQQDLLSAKTQGITWKFIMVPEPIQNLGPPLASDRFEGYAKERTALLKFIEKQDIDNVVFIAADIHGTVVNNLTYQTTPFGKQIPTSAWEISTGAVAYDAPLGPTLIDLAAKNKLITPLQKQIYDSLGRSGKDAFVKEVINRGLKPYGYDPIGLNNNLKSADGLINATLLQGDYIASHSFGWTQFNIDQKTQDLTVTTYGVNPYEEDELINSPKKYINQTPKIVSKFTVTPTLDNLTPNSSLLGSAAQTAKDLLTVDNYDSSTDVLTPKIGLNLAPDFS